MAKITDPDLLAIGTEITLDTSAKTFTLNVAGDLVAKDGVTIQALYSFFVDTWTNSSYNKFQFPMYTIDAKSGQFIFGFDGGTYSGWKPATDATRQMMRDGGWSEYSSAGVLNRQYVGIVSLGTCSANAQLYYQITSTGAAANFTFTDEANEGIQVFGDASNGNFDSRTFYKGYVREAGYKYKDSILADTGQTATGAYTVNILLSNETDLDVVHNDAYISAAISVTSASWAGGIATYNCAAVHNLINGDFVKITGSTPAGYNKEGFITYVDTDTFTLPITSDPGAYTSGVKTIYELINVKYFDGAYQKDIDTDNTPRDFGIVVDAGTHSGIDGSFTGSVLTSADGGMEASAYVGGTLTIHEGTDEGLSFAITANDATTITVSGSPTTASALSFTAKRTLHPNASLQQIYTKIQYLLRQNSDIDFTGGTVTGKTASLLLNFVGSSLKCGFFAPTNPNGGGTGVIVEGVKAAEINSIAFYDNSTVSREYPYASAGTMNYNSYLTSGGTGYYVMYFTDLAGSNDYGFTGAIIVNNASGNPIQGTITGASIDFTFDYTGNVQGGRTGGTNADVTLVAGNAGSAKPVVVTGTITQSKAVTLVATAEQDRAYLA